MYDDRDGNVKSYKLMKDQSRNRMDPSLRRARFFEIKNVPTRTIYIQKKLLNNLLRKFMARKLLKNLVLDLKKLLDHSF